MIDHRFTPAESVAFPGEAPTAESLEHRVHRLEDAVASLQDTRGLEERITARVAERMGRVPPGGSAETPRGGGRQPQPDTMDPGQTWPPPAATPVGVARPPWLLFDVYHELRAMVRMFFDRRYQVTWPGRLIPLAALVVMVLSWFILGGIWVIGPLLDKAVDVLLAFVGYKALSREAARYRATVAAGQ